MNETTILVLRNALAGVERDLEWQDERIASVQESLQTLTEERERNLRRKTELEASLRRGLNLRSKEGREYGASTEPVLSPEQNAALTEQWAQSSPATR